MKATDIKKLKITERNNGLYEARATVNGKRKSFYGRTKAEVKTKYKKYLEEIENGFVEPKDIALNDYIEYWLKTYKQKTIEPSSYDKLERVYLYQIKPDIGKKKIGKVTTKDIQDLIDERAKPTKKDTKALAKSGLKKIYSLLNSCLNQAVKEGVISKSPCRDVIIPKEQFIQVETKEQFSLNDTEMQNFKNIALHKLSNGLYKYRDGLILVIMLNTGLRVGEMLALNWNDIDFENKIMTINKTIQSNLVNRDKNAKTKSYYKLKDGAKTFAGKRVLPLNDTIIYYFNELKKDNEARGINTTFVCSTKAKTRQTARNLLRSCDTINKKTGNNVHMSLHTLRHTFGSTLIRKGIDVSVVSKLMGHANITVTYNKYIHVIQEEAAKAMTLTNVV